MTGIDARMRWMALSALLMTLAACVAPKPALRTNSDQSADFSAYRTFGFASQLGTDRSGYSSLVTSYFKQATRREMEARGYQYVETAPDLLVNFNTNVREVADVESYPSAGVGYYGYRTYGYGTDVQTVRYKVGTVNIDLVDARRNQLIWEGVAEGELTKKVMDNPQPAIDKVVQALFARYPATAGSSAKPPEQPTTGL